MNKVSKARALSLSWRGGSQSTHINDLKAPDGKGPGDNVPWRKRTSHYATHHMARILTNEESPKTLHSWRRSLLNHLLGKDERLHPFLDTGCTWTRKSARDPTRGLKSDMVAVRGETWQSATQKAILLEYVLDQIATHCPIISRNAITKRATSLDEIWTMVWTHFNLVPPSFDKTNRRKQPNRTFNFSTHTSSFTFTHKTANLHKKPPSTTHNADNTVNITTQATENTLDLTTPETENKFNITTPETVNTANITTHNTETTLSHTTHKTKTFHHTTHNTEATPSHTTHKTETFHHTAHNTEATPSHTTHKTETFHHTAHNTEATPSHTTKCFCLVCCVTGCCFCIVCCVMQCFCLVCCLTGCCFCIVCCVIKCFCLVRCLTGCCFCIVCCVMKCFCLVCCLTGCCFCIVCYVMKCFCLVCCLTGCCFCIVCCVMKCFCLVCCLTGCCFCIVCCVMHRDKEQIRCGLIRGRGA